MSSSRLDFTVTKSPQHFFCRAGSDNISARPNSLNKRLWSYLDDKVTRLRGAIKTKLQDSISNTNQRAHSLESHGTYPFLHFLSISSHASMMKQLVKGLTTHFLLHSHALTSHIFKDTPHPTPPPTPGRLSQYFTQSTSRFRLALEVSQSKFSSPIMEPNPAFEQSMDLGLKARANKREPPSSDWSGTHKLICCMELGCG